MSLKRSLVLAAVSTSIVTAAHGEALRATIHLKENVSMEELADSVRTPGSPHYGQPYTPEEILKLAGPSESDYQNTIQQLRSEGFKIVGESKTHLWLSVHGSSENFARVFQAEFNRDEKGQRVLKSSAKTPVAMYMIDSIGGLENRRKARPHYHLQAENLHPLRRSRKPTSIPGIPVATIKTVYGFDGIYSAGVDGSGQHIAIATYNDFNLSDVQSAYTQLKISPLPVVDKVQFNGVPPSDENSAVETQLDTEFSGMMAPGANIHVFSSATNDDAGELAMFTAILDDNRAKVVNYSWGSCESQVSPQHAQDMAKVYAQAVAQGVNILVASGDSGSDGCQDGTTMADWPASNPNVVAVGGTTLQVQGSSGSETAWSNSGGGISTMYASPSYQSNYGIQSSGRSFPDVSFNADPKSGQAVYAHSNGKVGWMVIGGTSMAAPQWAGFLALVNNARAAKNLSTLGALNPLIYSVSSSQATSLFNDVTSGSDGAFSAGVGYDSVTGLGSMKAQALLNFLVVQ